MIKDDIIDAQNLNTQFFGKAIVYKHQTDSTNNLAKQNSDKLHGTVFLADVQTAGRGRSGRTWISDNSDGLWMSILLKPESLPEKLSSLTLVAGLAVVNAMKKFINADIGIKWPNDIVLNKKKICGILSEIFVDENTVKYVICGIGVNLNTEKFPDEISNIACSVKSECGIDIVKNDLLSEILNEFEPLYYEYIQNGLKNIIDDYKKNCITVGKEVLLTGTNYNCNAYALDLTDEGELIVLIDGEKKIISSGEVSVRGLFGYV